METTKQWNDIRQTTYLERTTIGYEGVRDQWSTAPIECTTDTLTICGHPVMERWEDSYMRTLATIAAKGGGTVLELGFGMGISAGYIQAHAPSKHIIIEANQQVAERARQFAAAAKQPVEVLVGFWEDVTKELADGSIDGILFDTYPLSEKDIHKNHFPFFKEAARLLRPGGVLTYYSDEISDFSPEHRAHLTAAGFTAINKEICAVTPPADCQYWKSPTIVAPIITKTVATATPTTETYGQHLLLDCYGANPTKLADVGLIYQFLDQLPIQIDMQKIGPPQIASFSDPAMAGVTGIVMIVTSHISIHTYAKKGCFFLDVFSCKPFNAQIVLSEVKRLFEVTTFEHHLTARGWHFPTTNLHV